MAFASPLRLLKVDFDVSESGLDRRHLVIFTAETPLGEIEVTIPININSVRDEDIVATAQTRCCQLLRKIADDTSVSVTISPQ